jgi:hypothetical protein
LRQGFAFAILSVIPTGNLLFAHDVIDFARYTIDTATLILQ